MKNLWKTIRERWIADSPKFWKRLKRIVIAIGTSALAIHLANNQWQLDLNADMIEVCRYIVGICAGMGLSAQLTINTPS